MGKRVECTIEHDVDVEMEDGRTVKGVRATCTCCDATTESAGTTAKSVRRCLVLMREECDDGENSYFFADDGSDDD